MQSQKLPQPAYFESIVQPGKKYDCQACKKDTSSFTFILASTGLYCIPCFARLRKWPASYHVINKLEFSVLEDSWSAIEEIYMFQGFEKHGFGNWNQCADYIETNKTKQQVQKHYTEFFLNPPTFLPPQAPLPHPQKKPNPKSKPKPNPNRQTLTSKRIQSINFQKSTSTLKNSTAQIVGYMPLRNDYEYQYDNQAELLLAEMEFTEEDTQEEVELKFRVIEIYNRRLTERNRKKEFVSSRGILDLERQIQTEKGLPKCEKEIYNMMKIFSRFHIADEHDELVKGIIREKQLRQKIEEYKELHRRGYRTIAQVQQQIQRKNQTKTKKKSSHEYPFPNTPDARNNRRLNHNNPHPHPQPNPKKPSPYLTPQQLQLLKTNKLSSISYMMVKETLLREYAKLGAIDREAVMGMFNLERFVVQSVIQYLEEVEEIVCV